MSIALATHLGGFFHEAIGTAIKTKHVEATDEATSYLVGLLTDFAHPNDRIEDALTKPLAFQLDEALHTTGAERFQKLRTLGDGVLYIAGFFGDHIETKGVDASYVHSVGQTAYDGVAAMLRQRDTDAGGNVFGELSRKFARFVEVLAAVAETALANQARGEKGLVKLYERWLRTGSSALASELGARGIVPVRGHGGVH